MEVQMAQAKNNSSSNNNKFTNRRSSNIITSNNRKQFSSIILFLFVIIIVNLCPFQPDPEPYEQKAQPQEPNSYQTKHIVGTTTSIFGSYKDHLETCIKFVKLMFTNPIRLGKRTTRFTQAEAKVIAKIAKMWYIKKKIKKLGKKMKKHTIAVPVFTAIPIYEHSYYPSPHITHVTHGGAMHHAASSYSPAVTQVGNAVSQQMVTSASNNNHQMVAAYRTEPRHHHHALYPMQGASAHQIINSYAPSPPLYVDDAGGLYGHYGNAYGRYDGGYHLW